MPPLPSTWKLIDKKLDFFAYLVKLAKFFLLSKTQSQKNQFGSLFGVSAALA